MRRIIGPLISGLLVAVSLPPWGWWPLSFIGLALYGSLARKSRATSPFRTAFVFGLGWFLPAMAWMWFLTAPGFLIAAVLFASLHGIAAVVAGRISPSHDSRYAAGLIICHGLAEIFRMSWPFGGVPLATLGIAQISGPLASLAPLIGAIGISIVTLWLALSQRRFRALLIVACLLFISNIWNTTSQQGTMRITVVQGGGEQGTHAIYTDPREAFNAALTLTHTLPPDTARDMVLWPENVVNISKAGLFFDSPEHTAITQEARRLNVPFVVGITESAGSNQFTNAQVVILPDGRITSRYDKVRRVPFGEYMPLRSLLTALGAPTQLVPLDAKPGTVRAYLDIPLRQREIRASVAISWEIFFSGRVNEGIEDASQVIFNPTNGSSYTWTILQTQQIATARLRAREQNRWVVQAAPTGFSAFIDPHGTVYDRTSISDPAILERTISLRSGRTPYSRLGNGPYIWALIIGLGLLIRRTCRDKQVTPS